MIIGTRDRSRSARHTSKPEPSGSITSRSTRSGLTRSAASSASPAVGASSVSKPSRSRASRRGSVIEASSSTISTVRLPIAIASEMLGAGTVVPAPVCIGGGEGSVVVAATMAGVAAAAVAARVVDTAVIVAAVA
jgi:hypothetical protein